MSQPNVLIVVLDTARAQNLSCYGYDRETSPNLEKIAEEGIRFENALANAPWTLPSHASMFTGRLPFAHGAHARRYQVTSDATTLADRLRGVGYETAILSNNGWLSGGFGVLRGFENKYEFWKLFQTDTNIVEPYRRHVKNSDLRDDPRSVLRFVSDVLNKGSPIRDLINLVYGKVSEDDRHHSGAKLTRLLKRFIDRTDDPFFAVINYLEPHLRYFPPEPYRSEFLPNHVSDRTAKSVCQDVYEFQFGDTVLDKQDKEVLEGLYDGELRHVDSFVGEIYEYLKRNGLLDDTLLIFVGDHGENVGDHGLLGHNSSLHDTVLRVPFIIRPPGGSAGEVTSDFVQPTDIYRTVLSTTSTGLDSENNEEIFSYDLLSEVTERPNMAISQYAGLQLNTDRIESEYPAVDLDQYDRTLQSIYMGDYKLLDIEGEAHRLSAAPNWDEVVEPESKSDEVKSNLLTCLREYGPDLHPELTQVHQPGGSVKARLKDLGYY